MSELQTPPLDAAPDGSAGLPDHAGTMYRHVLERLHRLLQPTNYFEIGTQQGRTLALARCPSVAVDPQFQIAPDVLPALFDRDALHMFRMPSDRFFARHDPTRLLGGPIEFAFLDGMHRCEFLLRDFINTERHCRRNAVVALHDCLPVDAGMTARTEGETHSHHPHRRRWWTGDVWRAALLIKRRRPDLSITALDAAPTGLILVTGLDPASRVLEDSYYECVREMMSWSLPRIGFDAFFREMAVESCANLDTEAQVTARLWL